LKLLQLPHLSGEKGFFLSYCECGDVYSMDGGDAYERFQEDFLPQGHQNKTSRQHFRFLESQQPHKESCKDSEEDGLFPQDS